jgi:hypothetical protein
MLKKVLIFFLLANTTIGSWGQESSSAFGTRYLIDYNQLEDGFVNPPSEARLRCYWWWLNSMVTKGSITRDLEGMKAKGYGGAIIFDAGTPPGRKKIPTGPVFMSQEWMNLYQHAIKEAERLDLELTMNVQSGWNPGAPSITPEHALKRLVHSETRISRIWGGKHVQMVLAQPESKLMYKDITIQAIASGK